MTWKTIKNKSLAKRSLDLFETAGVALQEGSEFVSVEDTVDPNYKKAITSTGMILYVLSSDLAEVTG
jgi:hypothetical protein